jgi:hypothetical protein
MTQGERNKAYRRRLRVECMRVYGGRCCVPGCTVTDPFGLELHHPGGNGNEDRAEKMGYGLGSPGGWNFYLVLKRAGWPAGYVPMCKQHHEELHNRLPEIPGTEKVYTDEIPF